MNGLICLPIWFFTSFSAASLTLPFLCSSLKKSLIRCGWLQYSYMTLIRVTALAIPTTVRNKVLFSCLKQNNSNFLSYSDIWLRFATIWLTQHQLKNSVSCLNGHEEKLLDCSSVVTDELIIRIKKKLCERHFIIVELHSVVSNIKNFNDDECSLLAVKYLSSWIFSLILALITTKLWHVLKILCPERPPICRQTNGSFWTDFSFITLF